MNPKDLLLIALSVGFTAAIVRLHYEPKDPPYWHPRPTVRMAAPLVVGTLYFADDRYDYFVKCDQIVCTNERAVGVYVDLNTGKLDLRCNMIGGGMR